ncbi:hypothetical protein OM427_19630 [Halomonas sp. 18H]|uniref:hypothetical protein n=1 Tax=Halomonas almeriensis TaxID=308163 RepID=UPI0022320390|nr:MULTISPECIES: hypothetical protein [Halomonas]MCW4151731.1 hypothetical protein [Halomonas sp. 18H]MDN3553976.1 hypothetical protein [Halomonas almeriensis]
MCYQQHDDRPAADRGAAYRHGSLKHVALMTLGVAAAPISAWADGVSVTPWGEGWALGGHAGKAIHETVKSGEAFNPFAWEFKDYKIVSTGLQKELVDFGGYSKIYTEANVSYVWGKEEYYEAFMTPSISWERFMWDDTIDTTASVGVGMSYTSEASKLDDSGKRWMVSMIFELEGQPAAWGPWSIYGRLHHRSTAGIINDGDGGSNIPSLGVRYHFD